MSDSLIDFRRLAQRLRIVGVAVGGGAVAGFLVDAAISGLTVAKAVGWLTGSIGVMVTASAVLAALSALAGASRAEERGERLSRSDVGLLPPRWRGP